VAGEIERAMFKPVGVGKKRTNPELGRLVWVEISVISVGIE